LRRDSTTVAVVSLRIFSAAFRFQKLLLRARICRARRTHKRKTGANEMSRHFFASATRRGAFVALAVASAVAFAQPKPEQPDAGRILEQQRQPLRLPPPAEPVLPKPAEPRPALPVSPQLRVKVQQFTFSGNTLYSEAQLQPVVQEFVGKELDFEGLNDAAT